MGSGEFREIFDIFKDIFLDIYLNNPISQKYKLQKIKQKLTIVDLDKIKEMTVHNNVKKDMVQIKEKKEKLYKILENFLTVMNNNFDEDDLGILYENIIDVLFQKYDSTKYKGLYMPSNNVIRISDESDSDVINHELFHLSSTPKDDTNDYSGFYYKIDGHKIGYGLTEGYTELLNKRYFSSKDENVYKSLVTICKYLEQIIGQKKMEKMYLKANLFGLIKELKKTYDTKEIERFIIAVDFVHDYGDRGGLAACEINNLYVQIETITIFLFKGYCETLITKQIPDDLLEEKIVNYLNLLFNSLNFPPDDITIEQFNSFIQKKFNKNIKLDINRFKERKNVL